MPSFARGWTLIPTLVFVVGLLTAGRAFAQAYESLGTRALGMGGAFVAVADDATATYWNPAGIVFGPVINAQFDWQRVESERADGASDILASASNRSAAVFAFALPVFGFTHYRLTSEEVTTSPGPQGRASGEARMTRVATRHTGVTLVQSITDSIVIGSTFKVVRGEAAAGQETVPSADLLDAERFISQAGDLRGRTRTTADLDVGVLAVVGRAQVGIAARNLRSPAFPLGDGSRLRLDRLVRLGIAYRPTDDSLVALDVDLRRAASRAGDTRRLAAGGEQWWADGRFGVRAGLRVNTVGEARPVGAAGASVRLREAVWGEAQITRGRGRGDRGWGLSGRVAF
jgi:hypothetical protein